MQSFAETSRHDHDRIGSIFLADELVDGGYTVHHACRIYERNEVEHLLAHLGSNRRSRRVGVHRDRGGVHGFRDRYGEIHPLQQSSTNVAVGEDPHEFSSMVHDDGNLPASRIHLLDGGPEVRVVVDQRITPIPHCFDSTIRAGTPITSELGGTSWVTTEPAAIVAPSPMEMF